MTTGVVTEGGGGMIVGGALILGAKNVGRSSHGHPNLLVFTSWRGFGPCPFNVAAR
jgi:hypothetical protein